MNGQAISFDTNSLQTANIRTESIDHESMGTKQVNIIALAHSNRSVIPFTNYSQKSINITGTITASSIVTLDSLLDTFRGYLINQERNLDIGYASGTRRYTATANTVQINRPGGLGYATFQVNFVCSLPFGQDTTTTSLLNVSGRTSATYSDAVTFNGSAPQQYPIITVTFTAISGGTTKAVTFGNNATGEILTITRTWTTGDVLQIDTAALTVLVNGTSVDFTGAFPQFAPGSQSMTFTDAFTTRTYTYVAGYNARWL